MRKLATIQKVKTVEEIKGKDLIGLATFYNVGWKVIVQKQEIKPDDLVVYIEYDSVLPVNNPKFEFLKSRCYKAKVDGYKIGVMKMGGVVSEGIVFPLTILPNDASNYTEGQEVTSELGIRLYEDILEEMGNLVLSRRENHKITWYKRLIYKYLPWLAKKIWGGHASRAFPSYYVNKTDETRVQMFPFILDKFKGLEVVITEKLDGSSSTYLINDNNEFIIASRNRGISNFKIDKAISKYNSKETKKYDRGFEFVWEKIACKYDIAKKLKEYKSKNNKNIAIQGEIIGRGVQSNNYKLDNQELYIFNIFDIDNRKYFNYNEIIDFCYEFGFYPVPLIERRKLDFNTMDDLLKYSEDKSILNNQSTREGIVVRPSHQELDPENGMANMWSFKVINPQYLIILEKLGQNNE